MATGGEQTWQMTSGQVCMFASKIHSHSGHMTAPLYLE